jgi:SAM-dependent methyltransferase
MVAFLKATAGLPKFGRTLLQYRRACSADDIRFEWASLNPILGDFQQQAGSCGEYFLQDLWASRLIFKEHPREHVDIGSRIDGFVAHVLTFMPVTVIDIRPLSSAIPGLTSRQEDATELAGIADNTVESISSLSAAEHFGLGRYGDPIQPGASRRFMHALARVLRPGGRLYFSVPVGRERLCFNAHRVFAPSTVLEAFSELDLLSFSYIDPQDGFHPGVAPQRCSNLEYSCGLFEFTKR